MAESWQMLPRLPFSVARMLLLTDGSVLACTYTDAFRTTTWHRFSPDARGNYGTGAGVPVRSMRRTRTAEWLGAAVLRDGRVLVWGGDYPMVAEADPRPEIYDPVSDTWTDVHTFLAPALYGGPGVSCVLADGTVLLGSDGFDRGGSTNQFDPVSGSWFVRPAQDRGRGDMRVPGRTWTLLPDGSVLKAPNPIERYIPEDNRWTPAARLPIDTTFAGPALLLPDGRVWLIAESDDFGTRGSTWFYYPRTADRGDRWEEAAPLPLGLDGGISLKSCLLPSGRVLVIARSTRRNTGLTPEIICEFDPAATAAGRFREILQPPMPGLPFDLRVLPSGQALLSQRAGLCLYTPDPDDPSNEPRPEWRPRIHRVNRSNRFPVTLHSGTSIELEGFQLNGLSQAKSVAAPGTAGMGTNYPLVRLKYESGSIRYLRTRNHSTMAVATGPDRVHSTTFTLPSARVPPGPATLCTIVNGIASDPVSINIVAFEQIREDTEMFGDILIGNLADGEYIIVGPGGVRPGPPPFGPMLDPSLVSTLTETARAMFHQLRGAKGEWQTVQQLPVGIEVEVLLENGKLLVGRIKSVTDKNVTLDGAKRSNSIDREIILTIHVQDELFSGIDEAVRFTFGGNRKRQTLAYVKRSE